MKELSVIIPVYNNPEELRMTLRALAGQTVPPEEMEVLVADDGSQMDMRAVAEEFSGQLSVRYFWQEDKGFCPGTARNMGIRAAQGRVCVFLDSGVIVTPGCLAEHLRLHDLHGPKTVVIGYIYGNDLQSSLEEMREIIDTHTPEEAAALMRERGMTESRESLYQAVGKEMSRWPAPWVSLWSLHFSAPTAFMRDNGIFFDSFFNTWGCEDNDFGIQLFHRGGVFVLGREAVAIHYPPKVRSYERLHGDPVFRAGWQKNRDYLRKKYADDPLVQLWMDKGPLEANRGEAEGV